MCGDLDALEEIQMREVVRYQESHKVSSANRIRGMLHQATHRKALKSKSGSAVAASISVVAAKVSNPPVSVIAVEPPVSPPATPPTYPLNPLRMEVSVVHTMDCL
jgi:hypothetical protein